MKGMWCVVAVVEVAFLEALNEDMLPTMQLFFNLCNLKVIVCIGQFWVTLKKVINY